MTKEIDTQTTKPSKFFVANLILVYWALTMAVLTPPMMTIAMRVAEIAPNNKEYVLGLLLGVGAVVAIFANPMAGYFSDRTTLKIGKRKTWMIGGALVGFLGLWLIAIGDIKVMVLGWCITQLGLNAVSASVTALLPDQIPEEMRGFVSGALGMCIPAGMISGIAIVSFSGASPYSMFLIQPLILIILILILCNSYTDQTTDANSIAPFSIRQMMKDFYFNPLERPDFTWTFVSRLMFFMALATFFGYQVYFLMDRLHYTQAEVPAIMFKVNLIASAIQIASSLLSGWMSDFFKRRKIFIWSSAAFYGIGLLMVGFSNDYDSFLMGVCVMSFSFGVYFSVDMALVTEVLPDSKNNAAKDLGIFNIAGTLPQTIAPAIAPLFLFAGGATVPNYNILFLSAAVYATLGAVSIIPVRKVK